MDRFLGGDKQKAMLINVKSMLTYRLSSIVTVERSLVKSEYGKLAIFSGRINENLKIFA
jgi:hypothetical protein